MSGRFRRFTRSWLCLLIAVMPGYAMPVQTCAQEATSSAGAPQLGESDDVGDYMTIPAFAGLTFHNPVRLTHDPRGDRYYLAEQAGRVYAFENVPDTTDKHLVLDTADQTQGFLGAGLLGFALHPEFGLADSPNRGYFYVWYTHSTHPVGTSDEDTPWDSPATTRLSRFKIPDGTLTANPDTECVMIDQKSYWLIHNGGAMFFHPDDGFLYLTVGDDDAHGGELLDAAQRIDRSLTGGVLRIDVDRDPERSHPIRRQPIDGVTGHYFVPDDNPFVSPDGDALEELWCIGLRSPHTMTHDPVTGRIFSGDVGLSSIEEVNLIERNANYQWPFREGDGPGETDPPADPIGREAGPVHAYNHAHNDKSVIGGYVHRGEALPELTGKFIFGDNVSNRIWSLEYHDETQPPTIVELSMLAGETGEIGGITDFTPSAEGDILVLRMGRSRIAKLLARAVEPQPTPAQSEPGAQATGQPTPTLDDTTTVAPSCGAGMMPAAAFATLGLLFMHRPRGRR